MKQQEMWQVEVQGQIYESDLEGLTQWVSEGRVSQTDPVRRGSLRWLAAGKVPALMKFFNSTGDDIHSPKVSTSEPINTSPVQKTDPGNVQTQGHQTHIQSNPQINTNNFSKNKDHNPEEHNANQFLPSTNMLYCNKHRERFPEYICGTCTNLFCRECPEIPENGEVKCPICSSICNTFEPLEEDLQKIQSQVLPQQQHESLYGHDQKYVSEETLSGANWFFWIAALTFVNSMIILSGFDWAFVLGLAVTLIFDVAASMISEVGGSSGFTGFHLVAVVINLIAVSVFCVLGFFARKGAGWAFIVGMILYGIDMLVCLLLLSFVGLAIHAFALYCIYRGYSDL